MSSSHMRAMELFDDFVAMPPARRQRALAALAMDDPPTHQVLVRLLASDEALEEGVQADLLCALPDDLLFRDDAEPTAPPPRAPAPQRWSPST